MDSYNDVMYCGGTSSDLDLIFLGKVLGNLFFHTMVTATIAYNNQNKRISQKWAYVLASIFLVVILSYLPHNTGGKGNNVSFYTRFILFLLLAYVNGIVFSGVMRHIPDRELKELFLQTIIVFFSMLMMGYYFQKNKIDITPIYYFALLFSVITTLSVIYYVFMDTSVKYKKNLRLGIVLLMSVYIIISTYTNLSKDYEKDVIFATLDYYTNIINIFANLSGNSTEI